LKDKIPLSPPFSKGEVKGLNLMALKRRANAIKLASFPRKRESTRTWKIWIPIFVGMTRIPQLNGIEAWVGVLLQARYVHFEIEGIADGEYSEQVEAKTIAKILKEIITRCLKEICVE